MKELRQFTPARVGLGRTGNSLPTQELLAFQLAHARARDAVHFPLDVPSLQREIASEGLVSIAVKSAVRDRAEYLRRPDLGRRLSKESKQTLESLQTRTETLFVIADGLSPLAVHRNAIAMVHELRDQIGAPVVIVEQGRVAIADEIGELLGASLSVMLIGERPGLSSPDSLGIYLTWAPRVGRTDAERNCISNVRSAGINVPAAARLLRMLIEASRMSHLSGIVANVLNRTSLS